MNTGFYTGRRVLVTGGLGFLGTHVTQHLLNEGARVRVTTHRDNVPDRPGIEIVRADLTNAADCRAAADSMNCVFHLAAFGFGLGANLEVASQLFTQNVLMNTSMLEAARQTGVERYLYTSSSSVYPGDLTVLDDEAVWTGDPHPSEFSFGWAKRLGEIQARIYSQNHGMKIAIVRPANPYGPHDDFHPTRAHVVPSLIVRAFQRQKPFVVWGTGNVERSFIHADDVARAMLVALERYAVCDPINIAAPDTSKIRDIARMILDLSGYKDAALVFDASKPEGHHRKYPTVKKAEDKIGFRAQISLRDGLADTVAWYCSRQSPQSQSGVQV
jgi:GDP-L-fucose synthase